MSAAVVAGDVVSDVAGVECCFCSASGADAAAAAADGEETSDVLLCPVVSVGASFLSSASVGGKYLLHQLAKAPTHPKTILPPIRSSTHGKNSS